MHYHIKSGKVLRPARLTMRQHLRSRKILEILVISNHVNCVVGRLKLMVPILEGFEYGQ